MNKFEYASNKNISLAKKYSEEIIQELRNVMKRKYNYTFSHNIVGSAKLKLVTKLISKEEFDLDYDLIFEITKNKNKSFNKNLIKSQIVTELNTSASNSEKSSEGNTTINAKTYNNNGETNYLIDLAIFIKENDNIMLIKGKSGNYEFENRSTHQKELENYLKLDSSKKQEFRTEYLEKKNNNLENKESYQLFLETLNELI